MGRKPYALVVLIALSLVMASCGDDDAATTTGATTATTAAPTTTITTTTTTAAPTTTTAATTTTTTPPPVGPDLPPTSVVAVIDGGYVFGDESREATDDDLPFALGSIEGHWYTAGDRYVVVYVGLDLDETGPLCPGNSILTSNGYEFISNSPTPGGTCEGTGAPIIGPPVGSQVCGGVVSYVTEIPAGTLGTLFSSVEVYPGAGVNYGATGTVEADPANMPEIDPASLDC